AGRPELPPGCSAASGSLGARAVIAERDFSWRLRGESWDYEGLELALRALPPSALAGSIQYRNAATALAAVEALARDAGSRAAVRRLAARLAPLEERAVRGALRAVRLPGRFQVVPGEVEWILDIAHNPPAAEVLSRQLRERALPGAKRGARARTFAVIGVLADKDAGGIAAALGDLIDHWILCTL